MGSRIIIIFFVLAPFLSFGQQLPQFSQRVVDMLQFNPAYAGVKGNPEFVLHHRSQWQKFDGAPVTQSISFHQMLNRVQAVGFELVKDEIGPFSSLDLRGTYAHHIALGKARLSLALRGSYHQFAVDGKKMSIQDPNDPAVSLLVKDKVWKPDASFGLFLAHSRFFFGMSALQLMNTRVKVFADQGKEGLVPQVRHYYFTSGFNFSPLKDLDVEPSLFVSKALFSPWSWDLNVSGRYMDRFLLGASYRLKDAVVLLAGVKLNQTFRLAYSFDLVTSPLRRFESGSHEIILSVSLPDNRFKRDRWKHEYQYDFDPKTHKWRQRW